METMGTMTHEQRDLLHKLERFVLDDPQASFSFSARLAEENGWTIAFARRVVGEYKRFVFLCLATNHPCTPSEDVDQAWHLHLVYTRSYWDEFCIKILGKPLHHGPTQGGPAERSKHLVWYLNTLTSYRRFFGDPPSDIWPAAEQRFGDDLRHRRVNVARNWIIPKPNAKFLFHRAGIPGAIALIAAGCSTGPLGLPSIFDLSGPEFLVFYTISLLLTSLGALALQLGWEKGQEQRAQSEKIPVDIYILAGMAGGAQRMAQASIAALLGMKVLEIVAGNPKRIKVARALPATVHPVEIGVYGALTREKALDLKAAVKVAEKAPQIVDLVTTLEPMHHGSFLAFVPLFILIGAGVIKVAVGITRDRPVSILVILLAISIVTLFKLEAKRRNGKSWQERLAATVAKQPHKHLNQLQSAGQPLHDGSFFSVLAAAAGAAALVSTDIEAFALPFLPEPKKTRWFGNTSGGDSSSSDGGCSGGGCGGCGGGGGGCGGCNS